MTIYNYVSDIVAEAQSNKSLDVLTPIIEKFDTMYKGEYLVGEKYKEYVDGIAREYHYKMVIKTVGGKQDETKKHAD